MAVLLDTNVISEMARPQPNSSVVDYLYHLNKAYLSVVTIHELHHGIELLNDLEKKGKIKAWLKVLEDEYQSSILPISTEIAKRAASMRAEAHRRGFVFHIEDALIAATASEHHLNLATRNVKDFAFTSIEIINPWKSC